MIIIQNSFVKVNLTNLNQSIWGLISRVIKLLVAQNLQIYKKFGFRFLVIFSAAKRCITLKLWLNPPLTPGNFTEFSLAKHVVYTSLRRSWQKLRDM